MAVLSVVDGEVGIMDDDDLDLLRFAKLRWNHSGARTTAIRERFGLSETAYWQRLLNIAGRPEAWAVEPALCKRLSRGRRRVISGTPGGPPRASECVEVTPAGP